MAPPRTGASSRRRKATRHRKTIKESVRNLLRRKRNAPPEGPLGPVVEGPFMNYQKSKRNLNVGGEGEGRVRPGLLSESESARRATRDKRTIRNALSNISDQFQENYNDVKHSQPAIRLSEAREKLGNIVNNDRLQYCIFALIVINSIMMGVATFPVVKENPSVSSTFEQIDQIFLIIFTIEVAMQLTYLGSAFFKNAWLVFDFVIILSSWIFETLTVARAFRIFRAFRLISRVEVMRRLVLALALVIPNVTGILMLLCVVFYIFGVMFTELYKEASKQNPISLQYFVSLPQTWFSLFQIMCLDEWADLYYWAAEEYWWSWIIFIAFVVISAFIFANLIIAVICDGVRAMQDQNFAGLTGNDDDEVHHHRINSGDSLQVSQNSPQSSSSRPNHPSSNIQKLEEMEKLLDRIVLMQNDLRGAMELIAKCYNLEIPSKESAGLGIVLASDRSATCFNVEIPSNEEPPNEWIGTISLLANDSGCESQIPSLHSALNEHDNDSCITTKEGLNMDKCNDLNKSRRHDSDSTTKGGTIMNKCDVSYKSAEHDSYSTTKEGMTTDDCGDVNDSNKPLEHDLDSTTKGGLIMNDFDVLYQSAEHDSYSTTKEGLTRDDRGGVNNSNKPQEHDLDSTTKGGQIKNEFNVLYKSAEHDLYSTKKEGLTRDDCGDVNHSNKPPNDSNKPQECDLDSTSDAGLLMNECDSLYESAEHDLYSTIKKGLATDDCGDVNDSSKPPNDSNEPQECDLDSNIDAGLIVNECGVLYKSAEHGSYSTTKEGLTRDDCGDLQETHRVHNEEVTGSNIIEYSAIYTNSQSK